MGSVVVALVARQLVSEFEVDVEIVALRYLNATTAAQIEYTLGEKIT